MSARASGYGDLLRGWRRRRRLSQLDLAMQVEVSQRHLSFVESGRSAPSRQMVLRLADWLEVPLRERNAMLVAAGFAPEYSDCAFDAPAFSLAREVVQRILDGHEPYPALAVDRHWTLLSANAPMLHLLAGVDASLLEPPVNVLRVSLHPDGLGPKIVNYREWRALIIAQLERQVAASADSSLADLVDELRALPVPDGARPYQPAAGADFVGIAIPLELLTDEGVLSFIGTITVFGTPIDITLSELAIESFFPANEFTASAMRALNGGASRSPERP